MQSTGHTSTQERSFTLMHGSAITYVISRSPEGGSPQAPGRVGGRRRETTNLDGCPLESRSSALSHEQRGDLWGIRTAWPSARSCARLFLESCRFLRAAGHVASAIRMRPGKLAGGENQVIPREWG